MRLEVLRGGDPGTEVLAALAVVLTRPVVVETGEEEPAPDRTGPRQSRWVRAGRLEGLRHGRHITTIADLARHRA